jgi:hypothetical protein
MSADDPKTGQQRRALHRWLDLLAHDLNGGGFDQKMVLEEMALDIPWTKDSLKAVFRKIAHAMYPHVSSTEDLTRGEIQEVYKVMDQQISEITGVHVEFPRHEDLESFRQYREARQA